MKAPHFGKISELASIAMSIIPTRTQVELRQNLPRVLQLWRKRARTRANITAIVSTAFLIYWKSQNVGDLCCPKPITFVSMDLKSYINVFFVMEELPNALNHKNKAVNRMARYFPSMSARVTQFSKTKAVLLWPEMVRCRDPQSKCIMLHHSVYAKNKMKAMRKAWKTWNIFREIWRGYSQF